jgi:phage host-nuclease inhibitor protein Gam
MSLGNEQLKRIQEKLQVLLKQQSLLEKENTQLKADLAASKEQEAGFVERIGKLQQEVDILKLAAGDMSEADKKAFEKRINTYVKEIDRCIAVLSA